MTYIQIQTSAPLTDAALDVSWFSESAIKTDLNELRQTALDERYRRRLEALQPNALQGQSDDAATLRFLCVRRFWYPEIFV
jgi:hypothetical protein